MQAVAGTIISIGPFARIVTGAGELLTVSIHTCTPYDGTLSRLSRSIMDNIIHDGGEYTAAWRRESTYECCVCRVLATMATTCFAIFRSVP